MSIALGVAILSCQNFWAFWTTCGHDRYFVPTLLQWTIGLLLKKMVKRRKFNYAANGVVDSYAQNTLTFDAADGGHMDLF